MPCHRSVLYLRPGGSQGQAMRKVDRSRSSACAKLVRVARRRGPRSQVLGPQLLDPPSVVLDEAPTERVRRCAGGDRRGAHPGTPPPVAGGARPGHPRPATPPRRWSAVHSPRARGSRASTNIRRARVSMGDRTPGRTRVRACAQRDRAPRPVAASEAPRAAPATPTGAAALASSSATAASPATTRSVSVSVPRRQLAQVAPGVGDVDDAQRRARGRPDGPPLESPVAHDTGALAMPSPVVR